MTEKIIDFLGHKVKIAFNMQVQILYEDIMNEPFDPQKVLATAKSRFALYSAAIVANNPDNDIDPKQLLHQAHLSDLRNILEAISESMKDFYEIPDIAEQHVPEATEEEKEKDAKNV